MTAAQQQRFITATGNAVHFDNITRQLYATDASLYRIEPRAVAFPRSAAEAGDVLRASADAGWSVIPRGAGTGLVGGAIGDGVVVDFARENRAIHALDVDRRRVRVGAGVVLDQLNAYLAPHGLRFGPDVATSSRATVGGMIANNSSGSHVPIYGTTADHVAGLELVLANGEVVQVDSAGPGLIDQRLRCQQLVQARAVTIDERMPPDLLKRWPGYGLDRFRREPENLCHILAGSEGTLAGIWSAELKVVPLPRLKGVGLIFFASVVEAMEAAPGLLDLRPAAVEHIDRVLFEQTRGQRPFQAARDLLELDGRPCEAILIVEFFDGDVADRLEALAQRRLGQRTRILNTGAEAALVWNLRKAGLSLLTGCPGRAKPVTGIEDVAVRPAQLPAYVAGLRGLLQGLKLEACFYGHAASGLLHVRPVLDLHEPADLRKFRQLMNEVSALVRQFKGSLAGEHGVGIARTEFIAAHLGEDLLGAMREIKRAFDPKDVLNPGKLFDDGRYRCDTNLRLEPGTHFELPFTPVLAFAAKDHSFTGNLEQCNGCGGCRKEAPTMCPTFLATGDELMSTRGRANLIRAALEGRGLDRGAALISAELGAALTNCLSCKACTVECPSNVNMALLKAELLHARHARHGLSLRERVLSLVDRVGRVGCLAPELSNAILASPLLRRGLGAVLGLAPARPLPLFAARRFDHWFRDRPDAGPERGRAPRRGRVILWDDTFVRYHEPEIGQAAVRVLEAAGLEVSLVHGRNCCGRPAFSQGWLDEAARCGRHNLELLTAGDSGSPILFLEPSCYSMFAEDYRELRLPGAEAVARRCFLFERFIDDLLERDGTALRLRAMTEAVAIHAHCHAKSLGATEFMGRLAKRVTGGRVRMLDTGCCGMAGAFGLSAATDALSRAVAVPLVEQLQNQPTDAVVVASGTSCRHQIRDLTPRRPRHMAELLAAALAERAD